MKVQVKDHFAKSGLTSVGVVLAHKMDASDTTSDKKKKSHTPNNKSKTMWMISNVPKVLKELAESEIFVGNEKQVYFLRGVSFRNSQHLVCVGLGKNKDDHERWRQAGAACYRALSKEKIKHIVVYLDEYHDLKAHQVRAWVEGMELAAYSFDELKSVKEGPSFSDTCQVDMVVPSDCVSEARDAVNEAQTLAYAVNTSRRLGDLPSNYLTPAAFAKEVESYFKNKSNVKVTIWDKKRIEKERLGGLLAVAKGSHEEPRLIIVEYKGHRRSSRPLAFVGKGLTFDTGGISLKPSASMEEMKFDMCGAAAVVGALKAIVERQLPIHVVGILPVTENMPGGSAIKPGDVYVARNGKTVEVNNTDAEGRLILGEALVLASEYKPFAIVNVATLTGAIVVALGNLHTGYFTRFDELSRQIEEASRLSGEWVWRMPLVDQHGEDMKGTFADLSNISSNKGAGSATAAAFLENFVEKGIPWAHFDIAGTAYGVGNRLNYCSNKGASGVMVRTFYELAKEMSTQL
ncbi:MAG: leucyl aminopeptidase [Bdellovibrionaceae bacterium]|nr:leucyl aminopeptidase [Pseudobdellovibrionaceae bacterium]MDW8190905.1 leucyl aminopeptidase [Pseudobdellovibrionaceae bacterium]